MMILNSLTTVPLMFLQLYGNWLVTLFRPEKNRWARIWFFFLEFEISYFIFLVVSKFISRLQATQSSCGWWGRLKRRLFCEKWSSKSLRQNFPMSLQWSPILESSYEHVYLIVDDNFSYCWLIDGNLRWKSIWAPQNGAPFRYQGVILLQTF